ncbi:S-adenosyl-L-methionine-dependent methyltransferase [Aspergillus heterothallicus]
MSQATQFISTVLTTLNGIKSEAFNNDGDRIKALSAAYALVSRLETPWDTTIRLCMNEPALVASIKVARDLQLFEKWHERGDSVQDSDSLARMVQCQPELFARVLRHLAANHILEEVAADTFKPSRYSLALRELRFGEWITYLHDSIGPCFLKAPEFLRSTNYSNPTDPSAGIFQYTKGCTVSMFEYFASHPREGAAFNHAMGGIMANQASWLDIIPVAEHILDHADANQLTPLIVDVGGSTGHDLERFRAVYPDTASRLYLQDLPNVIERATCPDPVHKMGYDFFTPQPVQGARVYFFHDILHDWSDEPARKILGSLRGAFKRGYSKLLIYDHVIPETGVHPNMTAFDLGMMVLVAGQERTEAQWRGLLASAGFGVVRIWRSALAVQAIIEAELV